MIDLSFLQRKEWYFKPELDKEDYILIKTKDKYDGYIFKYKETDIGFKKRIKNEIKKNIS